MFSLLLTIRAEILREEAPQPIVIQLGENDLLGEKGIVLLWTIIDDLKMLHQGLPNALLFWSWFLECGEWRGAVAPEKVDG